MKKKPEPTRENIIEFLKKNGGLVSAAMKEFGVDETKIRSVMRGTDVQLVTVAEEQRIRFRDDVIKAYQNGATISEKMYKLFPERSITTINQILLGAGLPRVLSEKKKEKRPVLKIVYLWLSGKTQSEIAEMIGVSRQYVSLVVHDAKAEKLDEFMVKKQK